VGLSVIKQTISALEYHRFQHQHLDKNVLESQLGLCLDAHIRRFESAAKHDEPKCIESAQVLKASGSSSGTSSLHPNRSASMDGSLTGAMQLDTYTKEELERCSLFCLTDAIGPKQIFVGLRDMAMLLLCTSTALRGASCHAVELSDLFLSIIPSPDREGSGIEVK